MVNIKNKEIWFITGSQHLYGLEVIKQVERNSKQLVDGLSDKLSVSLVFEQVVTTSDEITSLLKQANASDDCIGIITWCHTFSPSKMWINGLSILQKPWLQLHTQFNKTIPKDIDMDFMNLNQAAHGDREHGFIGTRMKKERAIVVGHWESKSVQKQISDWTKLALAIDLSQNLRIVRFGDNMRHVAVTEGDKIETQITLGWQVNTHAVGDLVKYVDVVTENEIDEVYKGYEQLYTIDTDNIDHVRYQAKLQIAIEKFLKDQNANAFTTTFEDLHGLEQLPGLAVQELMRKGYGFGGEGDWKTAGLTYLLKVMADNKDTSFMEDYTYELSEHNELVLGSHMLEICPTIATDEKKPSIQVHPLGIGAKKDPARIVFDAKIGEGMVISLVDMGGRLRCIANDFVAQKPPHMPNLPVARVFYKPMPNLSTGATAWITAGGSHHTVLTYAITSEQVNQFCEYMGIEFIHINKNTTITELKKELRYNNVSYKLGL